MALGRIIVAQPASLCRDGAGILQVGVLRWLLPPEHPPVDDEPSAPRVSMMTVVAKATYSFAGADSTPLPFAEEQLGLALEMASELEGADGEMAYPSDFIPMK